MSFSGQIKKEIAGHAIQRPCCAISAAYGVACFSKHFDIKGVVLYTERAFIAQWAKAVFTQAGVEGKVYVRGGDSASYEFSVKNTYEAEKMLALFGHTGEETSLRIHWEQFMCEECFAWFLAGAFLSAGTATDPKKGYCVEFLTPRYRLSRDFEALLQEHNFVPGRAVRKGSNVLYFKSSEPVEDLLTTMGASSSALEIMQLKVYKDFRNKANRITNCETANIDKIVEANRETLESIYYLETSGTMKNLPEPLQKAAVLRKKNPDLSLSELVQLSEEPLSKSGLSHRLRKLREKGDELKKAKSNFTEKKER